MTELESRSLGAEEYRRLLLAVGLSISYEYRDEGQNHYYDAFQKRIEAIFKEITPVKSASRREFDEGCSKTDRGHKGVFHY
jgi:hypothetical protein